MPAPGPVASVQKAYAGYSEEDVPLAEYALLLSVFTGAFVGFVISSARTGKKLPERSRVDDLLLFGVATHKLSRIITRSGPTRAIRAPFVELEGESDAPAEIEENPRGEGLQRAVGELLTCPWCTAPWIASAFAYGSVLFDRPTRLFASIFATTAISDFLQLLHRLGVNKVNSTDQNPATDVQ